MKFPIFLVIFGYLLLLATDILILFDIRTFGGGKEREKKSKKRRISRGSVVFAVFALLVLCLYTIAICLPKAGQGDNMMTVVWLLFAVISVLLVQLLYCIFSIVGLLPRLFRSDRWPLGLWIGLPIGIIVFCLMWWGVLIGRQLIDVERVEITSEYLPESFEGYKIAQISDLHLGTWGNDTSFVSRLVDSVNNLHPDLIVFTGDAVNRLADEFKPFVPVLGRLSAPDGVYSVLGNHDYGDYVRWKNPEDKKQNLELLKRYQKDSGWVLLDNVSVALKNENGDSIILIGVGNWGEPPFSTYGELEKAYPADSLFDGKFKILLSHNPEHWNRHVADESNIMLTLAGHTHAMQMQMKIGDWKWSPAQYKYSYWSGHYQRPNKKGFNSGLYVNIGAGEVGIPMRIGANSEITLFTLRR